jgi:predicted DsbA family dithiol-disulfide isomerase
VERLAQKYGRSRAQAQAMIDNMQNIGQAEGIGFDLSRAIFANTFDAHRLLQWAHVEQPLKQSLLATKLFDAHLCEGQDLSDRATLVSIAAAAGLDPAAACGVVGSEAYSHVGREDERLAQEMGVSGVPFYVIGQYGVGGAQKPETFEKIIQKVLAEGATGQNASVAEGEFCGPEGC